MGGRFGCRLRSRFGAEVLHSDGSWIDGQRFGSAGAAAVTVLSRLEVARSSGCQTTVICAASANVSGIPYRILFESRGQLQGVSSA